MLDGVAVERVEAVADRLGVVLAQMQAENAAHRNLVDEMRGERHRLEVLAVRLDAALNPPCKHPVIVYRGDGGGSDEMWLLGGDDPSKPSLADCEAIISRFNPGNGTAQA